MQINYNFHAVSLMFSFFSFMDYIMRLCNRGKGERIKTDLPRCIARNEEWPSVDLPNENYVWHGADLSKIKRREREWKWKNHLSSSFSSTQKICNQLRQRKHEINQKEREREERKFNFSSFSISWDRWSKNMSKTISKHDK